MANRTMVKRRWFVISWVAVAVLLSLAFSKSAHGASFGFGCKHVDVNKANPRITLSLKQQKLNAGDPLVWRLENRGVSMISFGLEFIMDRFEAGAWVVQPPPLGGTPMVGFLMPRGSGAECVERNLMLAPGHYRFRKPIGLAKGKRREMMADFHVLPG